MAHETLKQQWHASSGQRPYPERSLRAPTARATSLNASAGADGSHRSLTESLGWRNGRGQRVVRYRAATHPSATDPTSLPSGLRCNKSLVAASYTTSSSLYLEFRCCTHRLNPQVKPVCTARRRPTRLVP